MKTTRTKRTQATNKASKKTGRKKTRAELRADAFDRAFRSLAAVWERSR